MYRFAFLLVLGMAAPTTAAEPDIAGGIEFFESRVRPIFVEHCYECHADQAEGGLRLDSPSALLQGGDSGAVVKPGAPDESVLIHAVSYAVDASSMPPTGKLSERSIADLREWVRRGAPMPHPTGDAAAKPRNKVVIDDAARGYWAFRPARLHDAPSVSDAGWPRQKIDRFLLSKLDEHGIRPAPRADRRTLIRRLYFDLIGLPPTTAEIETFVADRRPNAERRLVDRLLASPRYGERWARHWLDVVRYGEDNPTSEATCKPPQAPYRYRDWVVRALNEDLPYDEFLRRQLAADLQNDLPAEEIAATGMLGLSPVYHKEPKLSAEVIATIVADEWDERIDMLTRGVLGLTVACARCHDHKFDPIRTEDYYALAGVMASTRLVEWPLTRTSIETARQLQNDREALVDVTLRLSYAKAMKKTAEEISGATTAFDEKIAAFDADVKRLKAKKPIGSPTADAVCDAGTWIDGRDPAWTALEFKPGVSRDLPVFIRGNPARPGAVVPRRFLEVFSSREPPLFRQGSGRLELANAMVGEAAGLTARVIVNRVWGWHFGQPIVRTPSNFGALGDAPSHPDLLDDLAARFIASGWSLKWLHREIVSSAAYGQASVHPNADTPQDPAAQDGGNRWLWRMNRRRLEPEAWRDAALAVSGRLDSTLGGPSADLNDVKNVRRTIYGKVSRQSVADVLRLFDFPDAKQHAEERIGTTTPLQQLYLLNSEFVRCTAAAVTTSDADPTLSSDERLQRLFRRVLQRDPSDTERSAAFELVRNAGPDDEEPWRLIAHGLLACNEFLYVD
jgi:mono/diheme cytochrome c family protein